MTQKKITAILLSDDTEIISKCVEAAEQIDCKLRIKFDLAETILELQENNFNFVVLDCCNKNSDCINWIKVIKKIRVKLPVIIISNNVEINSGAMLYELNIFNLFSSQESNELLTEIFIAAVNYSYAL
jgi:DNA-binding NtrC family response regulator